ncbi:MAG: maleylpyruvate isomerase family mycothiol-dependent enzyme [Nocardioidaceae bacterium]
MLSDDAYWDAVTSMRVGVADFLAAIGAGEWDAASLCPGWRVRDVAGHLSLVPTITLREMAGVAPRAGFNPHRINTTLAIRYGSLEPATILARIRDHAADRRTARGLNTANGLFDLIVHSQDIALPLGQTFQVPVAYSIAGLERVWDMGWPFHARRRLGHLTLSATDGNWTVGTGPEVHGTALSLLLLLTGRTHVAAPSLHGPGSGTLFT